MLELPEPKTEKDRSNRVETLGELLGKVTEALALVHEEPIEDAYKRVIDGEFRKVHLDQFEEEASFMWELFTDHIAATFA